jgi:hypothetical protein
LHQEEQGKCRRGQSREGDDLVGREREGRRGWWLEKVNRRRCRQARRD